MYPRRNNLILLFLFAVAVLFFGLLQQTTPERIGSLVFFILVSAYAIFTRRDDVLAGSTIFFIALDLILYLFDQILPIWVGAAGLAISALLLWRIMFGRSDWYMALAAALAVLEVLLITQYLNVTLPVQAFLASAPFIVIAQHRYFLASQQLTGMVK